MALFLLYQKGSSESKDPDKEEDVEENRTHAGKEPLG